MKARSFLDSPAAPLVLALFCLVLHLAGTWSLPLMDRDEPRFAEASREMRERGDYVVPYFNNHPRLDKPPFVYWCQVAAYHVFGENEFAARLPSGLAAVLTAVVVFGFGTRLYGRRIGLHAAIVFTLSLQVLVQSKAAVADMCMVLFVALASWAGWEVSTSAPSRRVWWWTFYIALALGFLAKGPVAWLPIGTVLLFHAWVRKEGVNRVMQFHFGIPMMLALIACWGVPALFRTNGDYFRIGIGRHVIERSFSALEGHGAKGLPTYLALLPFYFVTIFVSFFPWSVSVPRMISHFKKAEHRGAVESYLISGILLTFLVFALLSTKLPHYTLPAFPLLSILVAGWLGKDGFPARWAIAMGGLSMIASFIVPPFCSQYFPVAHLARESAPWLTPGMRFAAVEFQEPSAVWYFRSSIRNWLELRSKNEILLFMKQPGPSCCLLPTAIAETFETDASWKRFTSDGINVATGTRLQLTLWIKEI